jgi:hypothetical protein
VADGWIHFEAAVHSRTIRRPSWSSSPDVHPLRLPFAPTRATHTTRVNTPGELHQPSRVLQGHHTRSVPSVQSPRIPQAAIPRTPTLLSQIPQGYPKARPLPH